jgi:hypothetical protein
MMCNFIGVAADHALSEAMTTIHGALIGGQYKGSLPVLVLHADDNGIITFTAGIFMTIGG